MNKTKNITIDDLGGMIVRGFGEVRQDMKNLETRLDKRIDDLEGRFDGLEKEMNFRFNGIQNQLDSARLDYTPRREHGVLVERVKRVERKVRINNISK